MKPWKIFLVIALCGLVGSCIILNPYGSLNAFSQTSPMSKSPNGFGELKWEDSSTILLEKYYNKKSPFKPSTNSLGYGEKYIELDWSNSSFKIGETDRPKSLWFFWYDKFYQVKIEFIILDVPIFLEALKTKYGNPETEHPLVLKINPKAKVGMSYVWSSATVFINLRYNELEVGAHLEYTYIPIWDKIQDQKKDSSKKMQDSL